MDRRPPQPGGRGPSQLVTVVPADDDDARPVLSGRSPGRGPPAPGPPSPRLVIRLLGEVEVSLDGHPLPELATARGLRLLARLALATGGGVPRDRLAGDLWPSSAAAQARTNLRKLLHDVRHRLPDPDQFVEPGHRSVRWCAGPAGFVDALAFTDALARGDPAGAVRYYGGDLLPGCEDDWVLVERERLRRLAIGALAGLAADAADARRDGDVVTHARNLLRLDPLHEPGCRLLVEALARRGERGEALRTYHRMAETLSGELGVTPEAATVAVADRLMRPVSGRRPGAAEGSATLFGRSEQWRAVHEAWLEARAGRSQMLLVTGEAGIGKTRLVEELARRVSADGDAVACGRAYEAAGGQPWGPVVDWLRSDAVRPALDRLDEVWRVELGRLLPELGARSRLLPVTPPDTEPARRHRLLDAVGKGLLAGARPLLLVVDDLQWCDQDTLDLCGHLVRCAPSAPVLVAGTARDDEVGEDHPVVLLRRYLAAARAVTTVVLGPLDREATAMMAAGVGGHDVDAATAERLWIETEGNPLFVAEAVRAGIGAGDPVRALTPTVHALITARLDRLPAQVRRLAEVAATIGRAFTPTVLAGAAGRSPEDLAGDLDELWQRHILRERGAAWDFSHDRIREVALGSISPARRRTLHRSVAEAIESHHAEDLGPVSARLAAHYEAAGVEWRAVAAYERAAAHAYRVFALDDGIALSQRALRLLDDVPRGVARDETELRLRAALGVPLVARRGYGAPSVGRCYERALTLHRRLGSRPSASVLRGLALHAVVSCRFDRAAELGQELVAAGRTDHLALVEGEYVLGVTDFWCGDFAAAAYRLTAAIDAYRIEDSPLHIARFAQDPKAVCLSRLALTQLVRGRARESGSTMLRATRIAAELDHPMTTGYVLAFDAIRTALSPETGDDLRRAVAALEAVTSPMQIGYFDALATMLGGWRDVLDGDLGGVAVIREVTDVLRHEQPLHLTLGLSLSARGHLRAGDVPAGRAAVAEALAFAGRTGQRYLLAELQRIDAELIAGTGNRPGAIEAARRAVDTAVAQDAPWLRDRALVTLGRAAG
ncbi:MAG: AAA family ATPase [Pseudonocardia sp.]|nr:AAA family ATPase [Pseudonocardia sp.]